MLQPFTPALAFGTMEIIIIVIFLAISGIRWILKEMQKANEMRAQRQRRLQAEQRGQFNSRDESEARQNPKERRPLDRTGSGESLEEIAARRRREIAAMNRSGNPDPNQPNNLTMQQMRERAAAKAEYQRRVEALRRKQANVSVRPASSDAASAPRRSVPLEIDEESFDQVRRRQRQMPEQQEQARIQAEAQRQETQRQRQLAAQQPQRTRQTQMQALRKTASARPASTGLPSQPPRTIQPVDDSYETPRRSSVTGARELSDRTAAAVTSSGPRAQVKLSQGPILLNAQSLRDAVILREILDPPMTLRDPM